MQGLQTSALRAGSHTRQGHWVRGLQAGSTPVEAVDDANSLTYRAPVARPRGDAKNPAQPRPRRAELCSMQMSRSRRPAVCRARSCHARAHCAKRSQYLAKAPTNGCVRAEGTQSRVENACRALTTSQPREQCHRQSQIHCAFLRDSIMKMMPKLQPSAPPGV